MPTYRITDPESGRTLRMTGDSAPTEQEIAAAFASIGSSSSAQASPTPTPESQAPVAVAPATPVPTATPPQSVQAPRTQLPFMSNPPDAIMSAVRRFMAGGEQTRPAIPQSPEDLKWQAMQTAAARAGGMVSPPISTEVLNQVANLGLRGGGPAIGQAVGAFPPLAIATGGASVPLLGAVGGAVGESLAQAREGTFPKYGAIAGAAGVGAIPGSQLIGATGKTLAKEAVKQGGANVAAMATEKMIDEQKVLQAREAFLALGLGAAAPLVGKQLDAGTKTAAKAIEKLRTTIPDENIVKGISRGYVVTPQALAAGLNKPDVGAINNVLESIGGTAATGAHASLLNQRVSNRLAAEALGLPPDTPLRRSEKALKIVGATDAVRERWAKPYEEISEISERAKADLQTLETKTKLTAQNDHELAILMDDPKFVKEQAELALKAGASVRSLKITREEMRNKFNLAMSKGGDTELMEDVHALRAKASALEDKIEEMAELVGRPELAEQLKEARKRIAQSYVIDNALDHNGNISAPVLGLMLDKGVPLTDELRIIGKFEQSAGKVMRESQKVASTGANALRAGVSLGGGIAGIMSGNPYAATLGFMAPFVGQSVAKSAMFSAPYQRTMLRPNALLSPIDQPDLLSEFARFSTAAAGREPNSFMEFLKKEFPRKPETMAPPTQLLQR